MAPVGLSGRSLQGPTAARTGADLHKVLFGGEKAATADKEIAALAKRMDAAGASADEIWAATVARGQGWFKDETGWSFEIPDDGAGEIRRAPPDRKVPLERYYRHPGVAAAYPGLTTQLEMTPPGSSAGLYYNGLMSVSRALLGKDRTDTLLHELQHRLDDHEGRDQSWSGAYLADPIERRAFNAEWRASLSPSERAARAPATTEAEAIQKTLARLRSLRIRREGLLGSLEE